MAEVVRRGRLWWFGHVEHRNVDDWVSACRKVEVAGARCKGKKRKSNCADNDTEVHGLLPEWVVFRNALMDLIRASVYDNDNNNLYSVHKPKRRKRI